MKAVLCPVCNGLGVVYGIAPQGSFPTETCHGCGGKGWVEVQDNYRLPNTLGYHAPEDCCPGCGRKRTEQPLTGCPKGSHYGTYCSQ